MSNIEIGVAGIAIALALTALRVPIGVALGLVSIIGIGEMTSMRVAWGMISATPFDFAGTWELTAAPMFLFMGYLCTSTNMTQGLFHAMRLYLARLPGASAFFAAASGSSVATSAAMSRIAVPEMLKHNYDKGLATGTVAASGTLGSLIPPSVLLVLYGVYAQVSVGQLFMAGFIPGVLSALLYIAMIMVRTKLSPSLAGNTDVRSSWDEKWDAFKHIWPLPLLIGSVLGGIFLGVFSPTEAGAVGTTIASHSGSADSHGGEHGKHLYYSHWVAVFHPLSSHEWRARCFLRNNPRRQHRDLVDHSRGGSDLSCAGDVYRLHWLTAPHSAVNSALSGRRRPQLDLVRYHRRKAA